MSNNDWSFDNTSGGGADGWDFTPQETPERQAKNANINAGFQPEAKEVQQLKGPWYWPLTVVAILVVGGLSFLMAYMTKDIPNRPYWLMGLIFAVPMAAMFLGSLLLEHRTCAMTPSYLRKPQTIIALSAVLATFVVGTLCDWIYLHSFVTPVKHQTVFVLDKSGSMGGVANAQMVQAMENIIPKMNPDEEVGLILFDHTVMRSVPIAPLSKDGQDKTLLDAVRDVVPDRGGTEFDVALNSALDLVETRNSGQPTQIIFLTDGGDQIADAEAGILARCAKLNVTVHGVAFTPNGVLTSMESLIKQTGGTTVRANDMDQLVQVMVVLTKHDDDLLRSQDGEANLMTAIMLGLEGIVIGLGMWLMLSVHGQKRVQMIISPLMGVAALVLLKYAGFSAEMADWWVIEGTAFSLLGVVFMTKNRLLANQNQQPGVQAQNQQAPQQQKPKEDLNVPDFDFF